MQIEDITMIVIDALNAASLVPFRATTTASRDRRRMPTW